MPGVEFAVKHLANGVSRMSKHIIERGQGTYVWTVEGKKLLDFTSGIGVTNTGHCHPKVVKAVQDQCAKIVHAQQNIFYNRAQLDLVERLLPVMPHKSFDTFFFWNSGCEAIEASVKLARHATGKPNIITFDGSFHGRTIGTMSLTNSKTVYRAGFGPLMPGVHVAPFPYCVRCPAGCANDKTQCCNHCLDQLKLILKTQTAPSETAAILVEPILGEGGYIVPPPGFFTGLREICDKNGILLIADEVQTGFGRTGKYFAVEHTNLFGNAMPDILVMAKGIASGYPLSAIASRKELMDKQPPGSMGGTYGGNVVACAAANATLDVFREENILSNVEKRGQQLLAGLQKLRQRWPDKILDIRGLGLMIGMEFDAPLGSGVANAVSQACMNRNMLLLTAGVRETVRFVPPLTVSEQEVAEALAILENALSDVFAKK